jgi:hypothetical protein
VLQPPARIALAEGIYRLRGDRKMALDWLKGVSPPRLEDRFISSEAGIEPFLPLFRFARLIFALGDRRSLAELIPAADSARDEGVVCFERALCQTAMIWATAWRGNRLDTYAIESMAASLLRLFYKDWKDTQEWASWYAIQGARGEFYTLLVEAIAQHRPDAVKRLTGLFESEWRHSAVHRYWPVRIRRQIILALARAGAQRAWVVENLRDLETNMLEGLDASGRATECFEQAQAWADLGENGLAGNLLRKALVVSLGVGYRKDYQLDSWIEWLDRVNRQTPDLAAKRIMWFARAVASLEGTIESRAIRSAAQEVVAVAFRWSPRRAVRLFCWFLDQGTIWHEDGVEVLLKEAVETAGASSDVIWSLLGDFLIPISTEACPDLAAAIVARTAGQGNREEFFQRVGHLLSCLSIYALPSTRRGWRHAIGRALNNAGFACETMGIKAEELASDPEEKNSAVTLRLKDEETVLTPEEVSDRIKSLTDLENLLRSEAEGSYFDWEPVVSRLAEGLDSKSLERLVEVFQGKHRSAQILARLSERLCDLGDPSAAWCLGMKALETSQPGGWIRWYDGGSRLAAFRALAHVDKERARPLVYAHLASDFTGRYPSAMEFAQNLNRIIPLVSGDSVVPRIWGEVEEYLHALFAGTDLPGSMPDDFEKQPSRDTAAAALSDLLVFHLDFPASAIAEASQRTCGNLLMRRCTAIHDRLREALEESESLQESALMILDAVCHKQPSVLKTFGQPIAQLQKSPNYAIRQIAARVAKGIGAELIPIQPRNASMPAVYALSLPPGLSGGLISRPELTSYEPLPDTDDPIDIVKPFVELLDPIAEEAGIPAANLCHRAVQIMRDLAPEESWSAKGEQDLRDRLEAAGLRLTFRRPRALFARRALYHVIAELIDYGAFKAESAQQMEPLIRSYDPSMLLKEPTPRPFYIRPISGRSEHGGHNQEWIKQVSIALKDMTARSQDGRFVLAEETYLKRLERDTPTEIRRQKVCTIDETAVGKSKGVRFFRPVYNCTRNEYSSLKGNGSQIPIVVRHEAYGFHFPGVNWLALSPLIGRDMGWQPGKDGWFRWVDDSSNLMVESCWWLDGPFDRSSGSLDNEVGEGWLVLATQEAFEQLIRAYPSLVRHVWMERQYHDSDAGGQLESESCSSVLTADESQIS